MRIIWVTRWADPEREIYDWQWIGCHNQVVMSQGDNLSCLVDDGLFSASDHKYWRAVELELGTSAYERLSRPILLLLFWNCMCTMLQNLLNCIVTWWLHGVKMVLPLGISSVFPYCTIRRDHVYLGIFVFGSLWLISLSRPADLGVFSQIKI